MVDKSNDQFGYSINIKNFEIYGYLGLNKEEKSLGQKFIIDVKLNLEEQSKNIKDEFEVLDIKKNFKNIDTIENTVNYISVCSFIEKYFSEKKYDLIETASEELSELLLINFKNLKEVFLEIKKPNAPTSHNVSYFSVSVFKKWNKVFLGLGSNIGDKNKYLDTAILYLKSNYLNILKVSSYYETEPIGFVEQDKFLNSVVMAETLLSPFKLLNYILTIEKKLERKREIKWGPRTIDIDILFYEDLILNTSDLIIPHKEIKNRKFVLEPFCEICPNFIHPLLKKTVSELLENIS